MSYLTGLEDSLEKGKASHSSIVAWRIPWTVEPMGSQRVGHNSMTFTVVGHLDYFQYFKTPILILKELP